MLAFSRLFFSFLCCLPIFLQASSLDTQRLFLYEHLGAWTEANHLLKTEKNPRLLCKKVRFLLKNKRYAQAVELWRDIEEKLDPKELVYRQTLRELCWEKLKEGFSKGTLETQRICLIAAAMQADIESIPFLTRALQASNQLIRKIALTFSINFFDEDLWKGIYERIFHTPYLDEVLTLLQSLQRQSSYKHLPFLKQLLTLEHFPLETRLGILQQLKELMGRDFSSLGSYFQKLPPSDPLLPYFHLLALPELPKDTQALIALWESFDKGQKKLFLHSLLQATDFYPQEAFVKELNHYHKGSLGLAIDQFLIVKTQDDQAKKRLFQACQDPLISKALLACSYVKQCGPLMKETLLQGFSEVEDPYVSLNLIHYLLMFANPSQENKESYEPFFKRLQELLLKAHFSPVFHFFPSAPFPTLVPYGTEGSWGIEDKTQQVQEVHFHLLNQWAPWDLEGCKLVFENLLKKLSFKHLKMAIYLSFSEQFYSEESFPMELLKQDSDGFEKSLLWVALKKSEVHQEYLMQAYPSCQDRDKAKVLDVLSFAGGKDSWRFLAEEFFTNEGFLSYLAAASLLKALSR